MEVWREGWMYEAIQTIIQSAMSVEVVKCRSHKSIPSIIR